MRVCGTAGISVIPVPGLPASSRGHDQIVRRFESFNSFKKRLVRSAQGAVNQIVAQDPEIGVRPFFQRRQESLDLGSENKSVLAEVIVERFDPKAVAGTEYLAPALIPDCERPHAVEPLDAVLAPFLVCMNDHLSVGLRVERVAARG